MDRHARHEVIERPLGRRRPADFGDNGTRYRSLGCYPCTFPVESTARTPAEIIVELRTGKFSNIAERAGQAQDKDDGGGLETLRRDGYM